MATKGSCAVFFKIIETRAGMNLAKIAHYCCCFPEDIIAISAEANPARENGLRENTGRQGADESAGFRDATWPRSDIAQYNGFAVEPCPDAPHDHVGGLDCTCSICALPEGTKLHTFL